MFPRRETPFWIPRIVESGLLRLSIYATKVPKRNAPIVSKITSHAYVDHGDWNRLNFKSAKPIENAHTNVNTRAGEKGSAVFGTHDTRIIASTEKQIIDTALMEETSS